MTLAEKGKVLLIMIFLLWNSIADIKKRKISCWSVLGMGIVGIIMLILKIWNGSVLSVLELLLLGSLPGLVMCMLSFASHGSIGMGDGILLLLLGMYIGIYPAVLVMAWALLTAALWAIGMLVIRKKKRQDSFPFVPFITVGYMIHVFFQ